MSHRASLYSRSTKPFCFTLCSLTSISSAFKSLNVILYHPSHSSSVHSKPTPVSYISVISSFVSVHIILNLDACLLLVNGQYLHFIGSPFGRPIFTIFCIKSYSVTPFINSPTPLQNSQTHHLFSNSRNRLCHRIRNVPHIPF